MKIKILSIALFLGISFLTFSQTDEEVRKVSPQEAEAKLNAGNYEEALDDFLNLLAQDSKNEKYNYNVAVCYLNTNINKAKAIPYLELLTHKPKCDPNAWYLLGRAYHYANRFDDAINTYTKFKAGKKGTDFNLKDADRQIQYCINAKELTKYPDNVIFENLGDKVNSAYNDHFAFVPVDESFIAFNTNRPQKDAVQFEDGHYGNSIYVSKEKLGVFEKSYCIGAPINKGNSGEEIVGLSANGEFMILYVKDKKGVGALYLSERDDYGVYKTPVPLDKTIDSDKDEIAATITPDGNTIYFASNRSGGMGGTDLYVSKRLPGGKWGEAMNLGKEINTANDEDFPNISPDGKMLYFSSNGHTSMGGYDIFHAEWSVDSSKWKNVKNLGFPINTTMDDNNFRVSYSGRYGYISAVRPGGFGDYDIFRVTFNEVEPELSVIRGVVLSEDGSKVNYPDVFITVNNSKGEAIGTYLPNPNTGRYVIILPPGKYKLGVELFGFKILNRDIEVFDKSSFRAEVDLDLKLEKGK
jgi:tetratricopeptide (TPR) repeat protein